MQVCHEVVGVDREGEGALSQIVLLGCLLTPALYLMLALYLVLALYLPAPGWSLPCRCLSSTPSAPAREAHTSTMLQTRCGAV
jgi:hypothetical protein